jgi:hypothetical protein
MSDINKDIEAYNNMRVMLESEHSGEWVLFFQQKLIGYYETFELAAEDAVQRFAEGPYLIRQIGAPPIILPASVAYRPIKTNNA